MSIAWHCYVFYSFLVGWFYGITYRNSKTDYAFILMYYIKQKDSTVQHLLLSTIMKCLIDDIEDAPQLSITVTKELLKDLLIYRCDNYSLRKAATPASIHLLFSPLQGNFNSVINLSLLLV
jgi:hypothetical protein